MSSFAALAKASQTYSASVQAEVRQKAEERERRLAAERKAQDERQRKEREEAQMALKRKIERDKAEEERRKKEQEEKAQRRDREAQLEREREVAKRLGIADSPKARKTASKSGTSRAAPDMMTWEEKRKAKEARMYRDAPRKSAQKAKSKKSSQLPGLQPGAIKLEDGPVNNGAQPGTEGLSVRERLAAQPPTLMKLNVEKRDRRTIDEIERDLRLRKAGGGQIKPPLDGLKAAAFGDWFSEGKSKKEEEMERREKAMRERRLREKKERDARLNLSTEDEGDDEPDEKRGSKEREMELEKEKELENESQRAKEKAKERERELEREKKQDGLKSAREKSKVNGQRERPPGPSKPSLPPAKSSHHPSPLPRLDTSFAKPVTAMKASPKVTNGAARNSAIGTGGARFTSQFVEFSSVKRKRPVSPSSSRSSSPVETRPRKKNKGSRDEIRQTIHELFPRRHNVDRVFSDDSDEDMEVSAEQLAREEARSAKLAKREDEDAARAEKQREEEKRRRKLELQKRRPTT